MSRVPILAGFAAGFALFVAASAQAQSDFALGKNLEGQTCRAAARFDAPDHAEAADVFCGAWEQPSGRVTVFQAAATPQARAAAEEGVCTGARTPLPSTEFQSLIQVACERRPDEAVRYGLIARQGTSLIVGEGYPADWPGVMQTARVLSGIARRAAAAATPGETPGLRQIAAVFPSGPPGQQASTRYELLRRRAYEYNASWSFGTSTRDFQDLLAAHRAIAPDDVAGEAEILAEIGLNLSSGRRFDEAGQALGQAQARATAAGDKVLMTKIDNYRAVDRLNRRDYAGALRIATAANTARAAIGLALNRGQAITAGEAQRLEGGVAWGRRALLVSLGSPSLGDRIAVLNAQGDYIAGAALRGLGRLPEASQRLVAAKATLETLEVRQQSLLANILNEQAQVRLQQGEAGGAVGGAAEGLKTMQATAPGTRNEALLWMTLAAAQAKAGRGAEALASGRTGVALYSRQTESPGMPAEVAAPVLDLMLQRWRSGHDAAAGMEYFETLALVWDGAASRSAAQLAARLVLAQGGDQARAYQDAERIYRAALARREAGGPDASGSGAVAAALDKGVVDSLAALRKSEAVLRQSAPAYLELLNPAVKAGDLTAVLKPSEGYLRLIITQTAVYGALVTRETVTPFKAEIGSPALDALIGRIRASTHVSRRGLPSFDVEAAVKLDEALLGPIAEPLKTLASLQVDAGGSLASLPFAALVDTKPTGAAATKADADDYTGVAFLARRLAISNTLGPATFVRLRKTDRGVPSGTLTAAVYGDFAPNPEAVSAKLTTSLNLSDTCRAEVRTSLDLLTALPDTATEARAVATAIGTGAQLSLGEAFTDTAFMTSPLAGNADVVLLATHGVLGLSSCFAEPALLTSISNADPGSAGLIAASRLLDRKLKARLVVLSACDTAGGSAADGGEALSGLARGFIYAGAANVLATQWKVDSASSATEISALLKQATAKGATVAEALQSAQKTLYDDPERAHPFYWAAFILIGDGAVRLTAPQATPTTVAALPR